MHDVALAAEDVEVLERMDVEVAVDVTVPQIVGSPLEAEDVPGDGTHHAQARVQDAAAEFDPGERVLLTSARFQV